MNVEYANLALAIATLTVTSLGVVATYRAARRQTPKPDVRIDELRLKALAIGEGENLFIAKVTNHGNAVAEILGSEVKATVDSATVKASIGARNALGTLAAGTSKELWLKVSLEQGAHDEVHYGKKLLLVTLLLSTAKGKPIQSSFYFSHSPSYGFIPSATLNS